MTYPTIMPALTLDFQNSQQLDPRVTFSRSSGATYINSAGLVVSAADHEPRFDHDPVTGECLGLLVEESRTNFVYPSIVPSSNSGVWFIDGAAVTTNAGTAPDGTNTASLLEQASGTGANRAYFFTGGIERDEAYSFFVKASSPDAVFAFVFVGSHAPAGVVEYTFSTGTVSGWFPGDVSVEPYPNGWVRLSATSFVATTLPTTSYVMIQGFTGDFFIWGVQREAATFPTSYIPTTGSTVTRAADVATVSEANFTSLWTPSAGTWIVNGGPSYPVTMNSTLVRVDANSSAYNMALNVKPSDNRLQFAIKDTGATSGDINNTEVGIGSISSLAWDTNSDNTVNIRIDTEGLFEEVSTSRTLNALINKLQLGNYRGQFNFLNGHISRFAYYNERLTDAELQTLTL